MIYKHTLEAAMANLAEIESLLSGFRQGEALTAVEMDLLLQKTRNFYDVLLMLKQTGLKKTEADSHLASTDEKPGKPEVKPAVPEKSVLVAEKTDEPLSSEVNTVSMPAEIKNPVKNISESLKGKTAVHESLQQNIHYQDLSSKLHTQPVVDLVAAIGINEKFLYIRELFGNDSKKFEVAMRILNNAANFNEAFNYMIREYNWDMDSELVQGLLDIVRRKFITRQHE